MFLRVYPFAREWFDVKFQFEEDEEGGWWDWKALEKWERTSKFLTYKSKSLKSTVNFLRS